MLDSLEVLILTKIDVDDYRMVQKRSYTVEVRFRYLVSYARTYLYRSFSIPYNNVSALRNERNVRK